MSGCDDYIRKVSNALPELATPRQLVNIGLYQTCQAAAMARQSGNGPEYFQINSKRVLYPKNAVLEFLIKSKREL